MAVLGRWTGGSVSILPGTGWTAPANLFPTQDRNDGSTYSLNAATSTLSGLPAAPDGFLIQASFEFEDASNGRHNPQGRFVRTVGTGEFVTASSSGYNRDNSEDRSYVKAWAFIDNPSADTEIQFQWRRDTDVPTGGTVRSNFEVIPFYYADAGIYSSASNACPGGTTPSQIVGFSGVDGANITLSGNVVTMAGTNKRYLCLGGYYWQGIGAARTQRWGGFRVDGSWQYNAMAYSYGRNAANADIGDIFSTLLETAGSSRTIDMAVYRGDGVANGQGGANADGNTTGSNANHAMVILELNDSAEVFRTVGSTNQNIATTGPVDVTISQVSDIEFNDAASFTRASDTAINVEQNADILFAANISSASQAVTTGQRWTGFAELTLNGVEQNHTFAGDYLRNNQGSQDTFGWSANLLGFVAASAGDDIGVSATELPGSEGGGGANHIQVGWASFLGINLDTMEDSGPPLGPEGDINVTEAGSDTASISAGLVVAGDVGITEQAEQTLFQASFTDDDDTTVADYVPELPAGGYVTENNANHQKISSNQLSFGSTLTGGRFWTLYDLGASPPSNYVIEVDVVDYLGSNNTAGPSILVAGENAADRDDGYLLFFWTGGLDLERATGGGFTLLDQHAFTRSGVQTYKIALEVTPTEVIGYLDDVEVIRDADTTHRGQYFTIGGFDSTSGSEGDPFADNLRAYIPAQPGDSAAVSGTVTTPSGPVATIDVTETGSDTASIAGVVPVSGTAAATEAGSDTAALVGTVAVTGTVGAVEVGTDAASLAGIVPVGGDVSVTESGQDTAAIAASLGLSGSIDATEAGDDTAAIAGAVIVQGDIAAVDAPDTALVLGTVAVQGDVGVTEVGADTAVINAGTLTQGDIDVSEAGADTASLLGTVTLAGTISVTEAGDDVVVVSGDVLVQGDIAATDAPDTAVIDGTVAVAGDIAVAEVGQDTAFISAGALSQGDINVTEVGGDTAALAASLAVQGGIGVTEQGADQAAVTGAVPVAGGINVTEVGQDTATVVGSSPIEGDLAVSEVGQDTALINAGTLAQGSINATEQGADTAAVTGQVPVVGNLGAVEAGEDVGALVGQVAVTGDVVVAEVGQDTATISGASPVGGTIDVAETGSDTALVDGVVATTGTVDVTEQGGDAAAVAGVIPVTGDVSATDAPDSALVDGSVLVQGAAAATEAGADTALVQGGLFAFADIDVTEAGQDVGLVVGELPLGAVVAASESGEDTAAVDVSVVTLATILVQEVGKDTADIFSSRAFAPPEEYGIIVDDAQWSVANVSDFEYSVLVPIATGAAAVATQQYAAQAIAPAYGITVATQEYEIEVDDD